MLAEKQAEMAPTLLPPVWPKMLHSLRKKEKKEKTMQAKRLRRPHSREGSGQGGRVLGFRNTGTLGPTLCPFDVAGSSPEAFARLSQTVLPASICLSVFHAAAAGSDAGAFACLPAY
eukprot:1159841-Pelagomonas_calceolata.AAC.6